MLQFIIGFVVGMLAAVGIIGFIAVATEEPPQPPKPQHNASWYMEDDGK